MHYTTLLQCAAYICICATRILESQDTTHMHSMQLPRVVQDIIVNQARLCHSTTEKPIGNSAKRDPRSHMKLVKKTHKALTTQQLSQLGIGSTITYNSECTAPCTTQQYDTEKAFNSVITLLEHKADPQQLYTGYYTFENGVRTWQYDHNVKQLITELYPPIANSSNYKDLPLSTHTTLNIIDIACIALAADNMDLPYSLITQHCNFHTRQPLQSEKQLYSHVYLHALELYTRSTQDASTIRKGLRAQQQPHRAIGNSSEASIVNSVLGIQDWNLPEYEEEPEFHFYTETENDHPIIPGIDEWNDDIHTPGCIGSFNPGNAPDNKVCFFPNIYRPSLREQRNLSRFIRDIHTQHPSYFSDVVKKAHHYSNTGQITANILEQTPKTQRMFL